MSMLNKCINGNDEVLNQGRIHGGAAGGGRPSLRLGIRRPLSARRVLFLLVLEVLSLLSFLRGALI